MKILDKILAGLVFILGIAATFFSLLAGRNKAQRDAANQRADIAEGENKTRRRVDNARAEIEQKHQQEDIDAQQSVADGRRDHLNDTW